MKKNSGIEMLRLISTFGVVMDHVAICWIHYYESTANLLDKCIYYTLVSWCHWPVPIFLAITGALLLSKETLTYQSIKKYFKRISLLVFFFGTIFSCMEIYFSTRQINITVFFQGFLQMIQGNSWNHLWYLYMLLGIYLVLPIIKYTIINVSNINDKKDIRIFMIISILLISILPIFGIKQTFIHFPITSIYIYYLILGYILIQHSVQIKINKYLNDKHIIYIIITTFMLLCIFICLTYTKKIPLNESFNAYSSPIILLQSISIFYLFTKNAQKFEKICNYSITQKLNRCSLGIYIIHMVWINLTIKVLNINLLNYSYYNIIVMGIIIFILSWITTEILLKIPILKNYL